MNPALFAYQRSFVQALQQLSANRAAWASQPGFAVYRNTGLLACVDALQANYPVIAQLVGVEWFRATAEEFVQAHPPEDPRLLVYGAGFPAFLAPAAKTHALPYLVDVAHLDRAWTESHVAADAAVLRPDALRAVQPESLPSMMLTPHPATRWRWCADVPAFTIWSRHREAAEPGADLVWRGEGALLTRPEGAVTWQPLAQAGCALLQACADGLPLPSALQAAWQTDPQADAGALLAQLLQAGAFRALDDCESPA